MNTNVAPRRLSELTHELCDRSLRGEFGKALANDYCALVDFGYCREDACCYANDGCWEVQVSGWSSRFRTLEEQWQRLVIERTEAGF